MAMAEACLGGIGIYPPYPSRLPMPPLSVGFASGRWGALATSQDAVGIFQYLLARPLPMSPCNFRDIGWYLVLGSVWAH